MWEVYVPPRRSTVYGQFNSDGAVLVLTKPPAGNYVRAYVQPPNDLCLEFTQERRGLKLWSTNQRRKYLIRSARFARWVSSTTGLGGKVLPIDIVLADGHVAMVRFFTPEQISAKEEFCLRPTGYAVQVTKYRLFFTTSFAGDAKFAEILVNRRAKRLAIKFLHEPTMFSLPVFEHTSHVRSVDLRTFMKHHKSLLPFQVPRKFTADQLRYNETLRAWELLP